MPRTATGRRHEIDIQVGDGVANIQATCVCEKLNAPKRFDMFRAKEDGRQHLLDFAVKGKPSHKGNK